MGFRHLSPSKCRKLAFDRRQAAAGRVAGLHEESLSRAKVKELKLHNGSRIAIIGGGPAGSFFAHFCLKLARQQGIDVEITVLDGKDFYGRDRPAATCAPG